MSEDEKKQEEARLAVEAKEAEDKKKLEGEDYWKAEAKKAFEARDEAKKKLKEKDDAEALKNNEFQKLYEQTKKEKEELEPKAKRVDELEKEKSALEEARRKDILSTVKDEKVKEKLSKIKDIDVLKEQVDLVGGLLANPKLKTDDGKGGLGEVNINGKKWDDLTIAQLDELNKSQPEIYKQLRKEKFGK